MCRYWVCCPVLRGPPPPHIPVSRGHAVAAGHAGLGASQVGAVSRRQFAIRLIIWCRVVYFMESYG